MISILLQETGDNKGANYNPMPQQREVYALIKSLTADNSHLAYEIPWPLRDQCVISCFLAMKNENIMEKAEIV